MSKKVFYAVYIFNDDRGGRECVAYCRTKEIAKRELKKYRDFFALNHRNRMNVIFVSVK